LKSNYLPHSGDNNKCPAGSEITYDGARQTLDAYVLCPLDSVAQSDWIDASQKGLCQCEASLLDGNCGLIEEDMECECFACPIGFQVGFAYECTKEIAGPCKSFDCFGNCNGKYDPGNLVGRETFAPSTLSSPSDSSAGVSVLSNPSCVAGAAILLVTLFRTIM